MVRFVAHRLAWTALVVWFAITATFVLLHVVPGDPVRAMLGPQADAETIERVRRERKLDRPLAEQYVAYLGRVLRGDLGTSYRTHRRVSDVVLERAGATAELALGALFFQVVVGVPLGIAAAVRRKRLLDGATQAATLVAQTTPTFLAGPILVWLFAYQLGWFPVSGHGEPGWDRLRHLFLPALTLAVTGLATYARLVRAEMIEALGQDHVRVARAKGLGEGAVVWKHGFRSALPPVIALAGADLGALLGGAVVVESIFAWPGLGREAMSALLHLDLPLVLGVVLFIALVVVLASFAADLICAWLDPRLRLGGSVAASRRRSR